MIGLDEYKFLFTGELIIAISLFSFNLQRRPKAYLRIPIVILCLFLIAFAIPIGDYSYNWWYTTFVFVFIYVCSLLGFYIIFDQSISGALFITLAGYATQHIAYECYNFFTNLFYLGGADSLIGYGTGSGTFSYVTFLVYLFSYLDVYWLCLFLFGMKIENHGYVKVKYPNVLVILFAVLLVDIIINAVVTFYSYTSYSRFYMLIMETYNILCSLSILIIMFGFLHENRLQSELIQYQDLLKKQASQYEISKQNIELLNIKCHDLKHQIRQLASDKTNLDKNELEEISKVISVYDASLKTNSEALNIVLMEKQMVCQKNNIKLSAIADGSALVFMADNEIYSLLGNALDNAIEASLKVEEEKRFISLVIKKNGEFASIVIKNYYDGIVRKRKNELISTKTDDKNHGIGTKSIIYIVSKYDGDVSFNPGSDQVFTTDILMPIPQENSLNLG